MTLKCRKNPVRIMKENSTKKDTRERLHEINGILHKYEIGKGMSPEKLRKIFEELGPTYVKLGQILSLHSDILPKTYCEELMKLQSNVTPMSFDEVKTVIETSYGYSWQKAFLTIDEKPLGSASIAQVHKAILNTGESVVVKVQRNRIHEIMEQDIQLLRKAVRLIPPVKLRETVDFGMVLDELWTVAQEEMDFLKEASNMEEFSRCNQEVAFVRTPVLYRDYTTSHVLVMEYIDGFAVDDKEKLIKNGYDLEEIGSKLVDNFICQVMEDGFFHADPHPGNIRICGGKIVWIDMGMMGRLTSHDQKAIRQAVRGVASGNCQIIQEAVLSLGDFRGKPDKERLNEDISSLLSRYGTMELGSIDMAEVLEDLINVMKENYISLPHGLTMLARGLTTLKGVLADISPQISMTEIAENRIRSDFLKNFDLRKELKKEGKWIGRSVNSAINLPIMMADILQKYENGQTGLNLDFRMEKESSELLRRLVRNIVMGLWVTALLISSSILCMTDMEPKIMGIPFLGILGYLSAVSIMVYVVIHHFRSK